MESNSDHLRSSPRSKVGKDGTFSGWLTDDPMQVSSLVNEKYRHEIAWASADFEMGDIIFLSPLLIHCTAPNQTQLLRISCDCRWHKASENAGFQVAERAQETSPSSKKSKRTA